MPAAFFPVSLAAANLGTMSSIPKQEGKRKLGSISTFGCCNCLLLGRNVAHCTSSSTQKPLLFICLAISKKRLNCMGFFTKLYNKWSQVNSRYTKRSVRLFVSYKILFFVKTKKRVCIHQYTRFYDELDLPYALVASQDKRTQERKITRHSSVEDAKVGALFAVFAIFGIHFLFSYHFSASKYGKTFHFAFQRIFFAVYHYRRLNKK